MFDFTLQNVVVQLFLAVPLFFLIRWLLNKHTEWKFNKSLASVLLTIIITPLVYLTILRLLFFAFSYEPDRYFTQERWQGRKHKRYYMSRDIIDQKLLIGKDSNQVIQ